MKTISGIVIMLILSARLTFAQEEDDVRPVKIEANLVVDGVKNFDGGLQTGQTGLGLFHFSALINTKACKLWDGGNFFIHAHKVAGNSPSENLVGDIQVISNIDGLTNRFIYECWYKQTFNKISVLVGLHNLNDVFHVNENAGMYLNSSFGISPSLSLNDAISIYPSTTLGGFVKWENSNLSVIGGLYNFNHQFSSEKGFVFSNNNFTGGFYSLLEFQYRFFSEGSKFLELKMGTAYRKCADNHEHNTEECYKSTDLNIYFLTDFQIYKSESGKSIGMFTQSGYCPDNISTTPYYLATGVSLSGFILPRYNDELGLAIASASINNYNNLEGTFSRYRNESVVEVSYKLQVQKHITVQPDFQFIVNPSGNLEAQNAIVGMFRTQFSL